MIYKLVCKKSAHFLFAQMAVISSFIQVLIVLGMYNVWKQGHSISGGRGGGEFVSNLVSLFVHEDLGVVIHGSQSGSEGLQKLIAVEIPFLVTLETSAG